MRLGFSIESGICLASVHPTMPCTATQPQNPAAAAAAPCRAGKRATLSAREVQSSVRLVLLGDLGRHAVLEGKKAVARISGLQQ